MKISYHPQIYANINGATIEASDRVRTGSGSDRLHKLRYNNDREKNMSAIKKEVTTLLNRLPDDASLEDVQYHLYVIEKVRNGLEAAKTEGGFTQEQAEERLGKWIIQ